MAHLSLPWPPQPPSSRAVACAVHPPSWHLLLHSPLHNGTFLGSHCPIPLWGSLTESQEYNESLVFVVIQGYSLSLISYVIDQMMSILVLKLSSVQLLIKMIYIWILLFNELYKFNIYACHLPQSWVAWSLNTDLWLCGPPPSQACCRPDFPISSPDLVGPWNQWEASPWFPCCCLTLQWRPLVLAPRCLSLSLPESPPECIFSWSFNLNYFTF